MAGYDLTRMKSIIVNLEVVPGVFFASKILALPLLCVGVEKSSRNQTDPRILFDK